jgi:SAM-dependent methyltransferase
VSHGPQPRLVLPTGSEQHPGILTRALVSLRLRTADLLDTISGRRDPLTPPRRLALYVGHGDFRTTGEEFARLFEELGGLRPTDRVLDIGCGIGRMARPLVPRLRAPGSYDGFDVTAAGIEWCQAHYRETPVPFRFTHADLQNDVYNPGAGGDASSYTFPYENGSFDFAFATSLFTHLLPDAADRYLAESARILAPDARLFTTWLLFDEQVGDAGAGPPPPFTHSEAWLPAAVAQPDSPEMAVAYPLEWVRERLEAHGLTLSAVHPGSWRAAAGRTLQDVVVARRHSGSATR